MRNVFKLTLAALVLATMSASPVGVSAEVLSLRGDKALNADSEAYDRKKNLTATGGFKRSWDLQPPQIPHNVDNDRITLKENTCLNCHSEDTYKKEKAPRIGDSHFVDAEGKMHKTMNMRRHFCSQCHVPQADAAPLVENTFGQ